METYCCFLVFEDYIYHTIAAKASGELCQKYLFYCGPFTRKSLLQRSAPLPSYALSFFGFSLTILMDVHNASR